MVDFKPCLVIPHFEHADQLMPVLDSLQSLKMDLILIDDGSSENCYKILSDQTAQKPWIRLFRHQHNRGKGAAVLTGLRQAGLEGFTHVVQIDADGQHRVDDIPKLLTAATQNPCAIISGLPQFSADIPKARYYGRMVTHTLTAVETLSLCIRDAMCGFRVYPLAEMEKVIDLSYLGPRMDFDIEVMVKSYWAGLSIHYIPTPVCYPEAGVSHFNFFDDNIDITRMHIRLLFGMLLHAPQLLLRKITGPKREAASVG